MTAVWAWLRIPYHQPSEIDACLCHKYHNMLPNIQNCTCSHHEFTSCQALFCLSSVLFMLLEPSICLLVCALIIHESHWQITTCFEPVASGVNMHTKCTTWRNCALYSLPEGCVWSSRGCSGQMRPVLQVLRRRRWEWNKKNKALGSKLKH